MIVPECGIRSTTGRTDPIDGFMDVLTGRPVVMLTLEIARSSLSMQGRSLPRLRRSTLAFLDLHRSAAFYRILNPNAFAIIRCFNGGPVRLTSPDAFSGWVLHKQEHTVSSSGIGVIWKLHNSGMADQD